MAQPSTQELLAQLAALKAENERLKSTSKKESFTQAKDKVVNGKTIKNDWFTLVFMGGSARVSTYIEAWEWLASDAGQAYLRDETKKARASGLIPSDEDRKALKAFRKENSPFKKAKEE